MEDSPTDSDQVRIEEILGAWFELDAVGKPADIGKLCADAPHLVPRIQEMLERQDKLLGTGRSATGSDRREAQPLRFDRLGDYELKSRIGSGGMGDVYLARQTSLDRMVAIKVLRAEFAADPLRRLRFKREAHLTAALDHPHIVPIYGTGEDKGCVYLVMKHLSGATLDRVSMTWTPELVARVGSQAARALHAAHEVGIVHRDIKPANIQFDDGNAYVLDFGLARGKLDLTLTSAGQAPGTLAYMPPEQLSGASTSIDPRGDVYSLGATLYQCLVGVPPFQEETSEALVRRILLDDPEPMRLPPGDRDLETIIMHAMAKESSRRYSSALELAEDLERYAANMPIRARPPSTITRIVKLARRHRIKSAVLVTGLIVSMVLGAQLWRSAARQQAELSRQLGVIATALENKEPIIAWRRLGELSSNEVATADERYVELAAAARATLARDALLDRIQLDSMYQLTVVDEALREQLDRSRAALRDDPATMVALAFLTKNAGDLGACRAHLRQLSATNTYPRLCAAFTALLDTGDPVAALDSLRGSASSVEDHVFTAILLHIAESNLSAIEGEVDAALVAGPDEPRARMMLGVLHTIRRETKRAVEIFGLLWSQDVPRPEMHCLIGKLAIIDGEHDLAARHFDFAERDLKVTGRASMMRLGHARLVLATRRGDLAHAAKLLGDCRKEFGDNEWFDICAADLCFRQGQMDQGQALLAKVAADARVPWNRRRALAAQLQVDVLMLFYGPWNEPESRLRALALMEQANVQLAAAQQASDLHHVAVAGLRRHVLEERLSEKAVDPEVRAKWHDAAVKTLMEVFEASDQLPEGVLHLAGLIVNRMRQEGASHGLGDLAYRVRGRTSELTRLARGRSNPSKTVVDTAVFGAFICAAVGDRPEALAIGAIANGFLSQPGMRAEHEGMADLLDEARVELGIDAWPAPE